MSLVAPLANYFAKAIRKPLSLTLAVRARCLLLRRIAFSCSNEKSRGRLNGGGVAPCMHRIQIDKTLRDNCGRNLMRFGRRSQYAPRNFADVEPCSPKSLSCLGLDKFLGAWLPVENARWCCSRCVHSGHRHSLGDSRVKCNK